MNARDISNLERLNRRYGPTNMIAFRFVGEDTAPKTVLDHIRTDLKILNSCIIENRHVARVILRPNAIEIMTVDNGTPVLYFFTESAQFSAISIRSDVEDLCRKLEVSFDFLGGA